ncbi:energy-coupling factor ABC transporter ATP-binding protein [Salirhabdus salicampi]|uniref:energy-coupling factor ABC transporter ATP-binding protein n=1 Tax=Salirhabdus salicampi TaxID=476102 RepID=UPI0020C53DEC|nr:energy-coupling factor ABC transporter ATP-binding protein [Salirhabdus salicampi]MCP8618016.1 energy-coupling factor ABC transporter ATP-binding protein [Salirhabdus salicampi]
MSEPYIQFEGVNFKYGDEGRWALHNVSFQIEKNEWIAIIGHNGSGKSTIAKLMNGLLFSTEGAIKVDGMMINEQTIWDVRKKVGMVFQNPENQFVGTTVEDDVAFGLENHGVPRGDMEDRIKNTLNSVGMLDYLHHEPHRLSGGQKQRVAIASVLAVEPDVLILDEATAMLDPKGRNEIAYTVNKIRQSRDVAIVTITHDLNEVMYADRVIVMNEGEIWMIGSVEEVFQKQEQLDEIGLDIPFVTRLTKDLRAEGIKIETEPKNQKELIDQLWTLYSKK